MARDQVLILDDEPHMLEWLIEYLKAKDLDVVFATNLREAVNLLDTSERKFRFLILDLNVPDTGELVNVLAEKGKVYENYRGLYVAEFARNIGYRGRQVIVYSVHDLDEVRLVIDKLGVTYVTKGRPRVFKQEIEDVLSYDPTTIARMK